jgi:hypothetical protein
VLPSRIGWVQHQRERVQQSRRLNQADRPLSSISVSHRGARGIHADQGTLGPQRRNRAALVGAQAPCPHLVPGGRWRGVVSSVEHEDDGISVAWSWVSASRATWFLNGKGLSEPAHLDQSAPAAREGGACVRELETRGRMACHELWPRRHAPQWLGLPRQGDRWSGPRCAAVLVEDAPSPVAVRGRAYSQVIE